ncbi:SAM-dependent chlorinase/fluorinase [bacterium]|nr:SAM-dependent chlorinase/fluorinase [bacterium]
MIVTLITDFGYTDPYVGSMKGVMLGINPDVQIVDITHDVTPQNIDEAAFILKRSYSFFPEGTMHVIVVDPGVGSTRSIIGVKTDSALFLAPDNGVLKYIFYHHSVKVYQITNQDYFRDHVSHTFHGRDIFAPIAAHMSRGITLDILGQPSENYIKGELSNPVVEAEHISGEITYIDRFGNGITNIGGNLVTGLKKMQIHIKTTTVKKLSNRYIDVPLGEPLALIGSGNTLEISVHQGNAAQQIGFRVGDPITVSFE